MKKREKKSRVINYFSYFIFRVKIQKLGCSAPLTWAEAESLSVFILGYADLFVGKYSIIVINFIQSYTFLNMHKSAEYGAPFVYPNLCNVCFAYLIK